MCPTGKYVKAEPCLSFEKKNGMKSISSSKAKKWSLLIFEIHFSILLFLRLFKTTRNEKVVKVSQKYIDILLTYFRFPTWPVYLCSATVEQPLPVMFCCISAVSYDRCAIHCNFPMTYLL